MAKEVSDNFQSGLWATVALVEVFPVRLGEAARLHRQNQG
jgi:hypothetical protein